MITKVMKESLFQSHVKVRVLFMRRTFISRLDVLATTNQHTKHHYSSPFFLLSLNIFPRKPFLIYLFVTLYVMILAASAMTLSFLSALTCDDCSSYFKCGNFFLATRLINLMWNYLKFLFFFALSKTDDYVNVTHPHERF